MKTTVYAPAPRLIFSDSATENPAKVPRIAVIDDDPMFGRIMEQLGRKAGVEIKHLEDFKALDGIDVAIVDYDLGSMTGLDVSIHIEKVIGALSVILVSRSQLPRDRGWPPCIKGFVYKGMGPWAILDAAIEAYGLSTVDKNIRKLRRFANAKARPN